MKRRTFLTGLTGGAIAGTTVARGAPTAGGGSNETGGGGSSPQTHTVGMYTTGPDARGNVYFDPIGLYVNPGDTVKWVVESGKHSTTSYTPDNPIYGGPSLVPDGAQSWDSGVLSTQGASFSRTFTVKGTYDYYCIPHKSLGMVGRIVCGAPGGPAEQNAIPSSDHPTGIMPPGDVIVNQGSVAFPYVPKTSHGGPPLLFWGGMGAFVAASVYLFGVYDRKSGRYDELSVAELGGEDEP